MVRTGGVNLKGQRLERPMTRNNGRVNALRVCECEGDTAGARTERTPCPLACVCRCPVRVQHLQGGSQLGQVEPALNLRRRRRFLCLRGSARVRGQCQTAVV